MSLFSKLFGKKKKHHHSAPPVSQTYDSQPQCVVEESKAGVSEPCDCVESAESEHIYCLDNESEDD